MEFLVVVLIVVYRHCELFVYIDSLFVCDPFDYPYLLNQTNSFFYIMVFSDRCKSVCLGKYSVRTLLLWLWSCVAIVINLYYHLQIFLIVLFFLMGLYLNVFALIKIQDTYLCAYLLFLIIHIFLVGSFLYR